VRLSRLPIRVRVTAAFVLATGALLGATAFLLYAHLAGSLDRTLDQGLRARAADVAALVQQADTGLSEARAPAAAGATATFAQVLRTDGRVVDETRGLAHKPLLTRSQLSHARLGSTIVGRATRYGTEVRLLAFPLHAQDRQLVVVVGSPLAQRDETLASLRSELVIGGPLALLAVGLIGYLVAASALRPVERMRRRAGSITEHDLSERLPVARAHDELARLGSTLNEMLARIEHGVKRERAFVADAAHELRTPLSLLRAEVELALEEPRTATELRAALRSVGEEVDRLTQLAQDLLLLARLDEGRLSLRRESLCVRELLEGVQSRFGRRAHDAKRRIAVADDGPGFPPAFVPTAFDRFARADHGREGTGAGLGLAIVKAIVEAHGGRVDAGRASSGGAEVRIELPGEPSATRRSQVPFRNRVGDSTTVAA
jgi:signal transduction histidine kinase